MRKCLTVIALLFSLHGYSQSFCLIPYGGIGISTIHTDNYTKDLVHSHTSWEAGIGVKYKFSEHLSAVSGIDFVSTSYKLGDYIFENNFDPLTGTMVGIPGHIIYQFQYLRVPLEISYDITLGKKFEMGLQAGIALSSLLNVSATSNINNYRTAPHKSDYKPFNLWMLASAHATYRVNNKLGLSLAPSYGYILAPSNQEHPQQFHTVGARLGLIVKL